MPTHSRKPKSTYSLTRLYDGRLCLVLAPSLPPPMLSRQESSSCESSPSTLSLSPASAPKNEPSSTPASTSPRLFQPYPSHFPWARTIASSHRNIYLYKETQAEIIQRDKRIASREAAYKEFYARMADESRANHVGVTTRSAAAAALSGIPREHLKRSSRVVARTTHDPVYDDTLDDPGSPPRKKARTTVRTASNNRTSTSNSTVNQTTRNNNAESSSAKVSKPPLANAATTNSSTRLTTRSQTKLRQTTSRSLTCPGEDLSVTENPLSEVDVDREAVSVVDNDTESQPPIAQETAHIEKATPASDKVDTSRSKTQPTEKTLSPELNTPRKTLGRASSTSSTLASSRQSSDDGYRKSDPRFTDGQSIDDDVGVELIDAELSSATATNASSDSNQTLNEHGTLRSAVADFVAAQQPSFALQRLANSREGKVTDKRSSRSPSPQPHKSGTAAKKTGKEKSFRKRSHSSNEDNEDEDEANCSSSGQNPAESLVVIPPEVRRSGRVSKKRKLE